jgi:hypothetical protein
VENHSESLCMKTAILAGNIRPPMAVTVFFSITAMVGRPGSMCQVRNCQISVGTCLPPGCHPSDALPVRVPFSRSIRVTAAESLLSMSVVSWIRLCADLGRSACVCSKWSAKVMAAS